jgi:stress response protein YsnF
MRPSWIVTTILAAVVAVSATARAHDGHVHRIMGTVTVRDAKHLEVKTPSGEVLSIAITDKTNALRNKKKVDLKEVQIGRRVVVDIGNGEDPLKAGEIHVGATTLAAVSPDVH